MTQLSYEQSHILKYIETLADDLNAMRELLKDYWENKEE